MAHSLSSKKRIRQNETRRARNRSRTSALRSTVRTCADPLLHNEADAASKALPAVAKALDQAAARKTIHRNAAARKKSRLAKKINAMKAKASG